MCDLRSLTVRKEHVEGERGYNKLTAMCVRVETHILYVMIGQSEVPEGSVVAHSFRKTLSALRVRV